MPARQVQAVCIKDTTQLISPTNVVTKIGPPTTHPAINVETSGKQASRRNPMVNGAAFEESALKAPQNV